MTETLIVPFSTGKCEGLLVKVPDDASGFNLVRSGTYLLKYHHTEGSALRTVNIGVTTDNYYKILGLSKGLTEEQCKDILDILGEDLYDFDTIMRRLQCFSKYPYDDNIAAMSKGEYLLREEAHSRTGNWLVLVKK